MSPSEATNQATREEWRELGFFYELQDEPPRWRIVGSPSGLGNLVKVLDKYVRDPRHEAISEHEHYGPYMYLKVQTAETPTIDNESIRGSLSDLVHLRDLIANGLRNLRAGESLVVGPEYSPAVRFPLHLELREAEFDPASADPALSESAV
jgi:hypothetical protein